MSRPDVQLCLRLQGFLGSIVSLSVLYFFQNHIYFSTASLLGGAILYSIYTLLNATFSYCFINLRGSFGLGFILDVYKIIYLILLLCRFWRTKQ